MAMHKSLVIRLQFVDVHVSEEQCYNCKDNVRYYRGFMGTLATWMKIGKQKARILVLLETSARPVLCPLVIVVSLTHKNFSTLRNMLGINMTSLILLDTMCIHLTTIVGRYLVHMMLLVFYVSCSIPLQSMISSVSYRHAKEIKILNMESSCIAHSPVQFWTR